MALKLEGIESAKKNNLIPGKPDFNYFKEAMKKDLVLEGKAIMTYLDEKLGTNVLVLDLGGIKGIIKKDEIDCERSVRSLVEFVGRKVWFMVIGVDDDEKIVICSRKKAQEKMREENYKEIAEGKEVQGIVRNFITYGTFIDLGGITAMLKNYDFSEDGTPANEVLKINDLIDVRIKRIDKTEDKDKIFVELVKKYVSPTIRNTTKLEKDQVVLGRVKRIYGNKAFINVLPGRDALAEVPPTGNIFEGAEVKIRITVVDVRDGKDILRGKIIV